MPPKLLSPPSGNVNKQNSTDYITQTFQKRECSAYVPLSKETPERCCCGQHKNSHQPCKTFPYTTYWNIAEHTKLFETDSYGTIEFMGGQHPYKAQFVRLSFDSDPANIMHLFQNVWRIKGPNLVITIHGSFENIQLQTKLTSVFQNGLMKATKTTGAWIITTGLNSSGIVRRVAKALKEAGHVKSRKNIVSIGVAPWGLVKKRNVLKDKPGGTVQYFPQAMNIRSSDAALNNRHTYFLLADNGTRGRHGADIILRKRLEEYILTHDKEKSGKTTPVVCIVLDGGCLSLRSALDNIFQWPPIPVVVCIDSTKIANLIGNIVKLRMQNAIERNEISTLSTISQVFNCKLDQAKVIYHELLLLCLLPKYYHQITAFEIGEDFQNQNDFDHAILTALLKCHQNHDQLILALTWNRADIAKSDILIHTKEWTADFLGRAMLEALKHDRVDFVRLLIENGVQMDKFLTVLKLECLYNTNKGPVNTLSYIVRDVTRTGADYKYKLPDIGLVLEKLMGGTYKSQYTSIEFKTRYMAQLLADKSMMNTMKVTASDPSRTAEMEYDNDNDFKYPFSELFIWAVLTKRHQMALCMWQHGEQALTKALVAVRLYKFLSYEATDDYLDQEVFDDYQKHAKEFQRLSIELLEQCYHTDRDSTLRLLTYELTNWGKQTNLSLAFIAFNKEFVAHTCCQYLLSDLWLGGLRIRRYSAVQIIVALFFPAFILALNYKSKEELALQPQRADELRALDLEGLLEAGATQSDVDNDEDSFSVVNAPNEKPGLLKSIKLPLGRSPARSPARSPKTSQKESSHLPASLKGGSRARHKDSSGTSVGQKIRSTYRSNYGFGQAERPLSPYKKFNEFVAAPVTNFWTWTVAYVFFLCLFSLTVLTTIEQWPRGPDWSEWYMMAYVVTLACENFRRICISEGRSFWIKIKLYFSKPWATVYASAILLFFAAMSLRFFERFFTYAILCYICDSVFWYILFLDIISVHFQMGVYVIMLKKMIINMFQVLLILTCVLISFGVVRQSIHNRQNNWNFFILRNVLYKPYFMLYGEVYAPEIDPCGDEGKDCDDSGHWITPFYMAIFMLLSNILIVNLMIAVFNNIFADINAKAQEVWRFYRYSVVLDYEYRPFLPPPFIILYHLYFLLKLGFVKRRKGQLEQPLKMNLTDEVVDGVLDFEEMCMEDLQRSKDFRKQLTIDEKIRATCDRVEYLSMKQDDFNVRLQMMKQNTDNRLRQILDCQKKVYPNAFDRRGEENIERTQTDTNA